MTGIFTSIDFPPDMRGDDVCNKFLYCIDNPQIEESLDLG
jgi:hypothetical protein